MGNNESRQNAAGPSQTSPAGAAGQQRHEERTSADSAESAGSDGAPGQERGSTGSADTRPTVKSPWAVVAREMLPNTSQRTPTDPWSNVVRGLAQTGPKPGKVLVKQPPPQQLVTYYYSSGVRGLVDAERQKLPEPATPDGAFICPICGKKVTARNPYPHVYQCRRRLSPSDPNA